MKIPIYQIDAFTNSVFSGNPAAICPLNEWLEHGTLQLIAAENNLSETAFFVKQNDCYELRWFTPTMEVDLCGHATLASAFVIFNHLDSSLNEIWKGIPAIRKLGHKISPDDNKYVHLHAAQLIKHILGLNNAVGKGNYRLLYLWYDAPGLDGCKHRKEIEKFTKYMKADNIKFSHITYQEVIRNLVKHHYKTNEKYLNYLSSRYL